MKRIALILSLALVGCAHQDAYLNTYRAGVITKGVVTEAHQTRWSDPLRERAAECDEKLSNDDTPDDQQFDELQACLGPYNSAANDKVVQALAIYKTAMETLTAILIAAENNPEGVDKDALNKALGDALSSARELIALFPEAQEWVNRLELLVKGLVK